jgi:hypothetical protein
MFSCIGCLSCVFVVVLSIFDLSFKSQRSQITDLLYIDIYVLLPFALSSIP